MFNNKNNSGELEYFDLEFSDNKTQLSGKNPQICMSCHGINGNKGIGGPKPIFEVTPWRSTPMFNNQLLTHETLGCPNRKTVDSLVTSKLKHAFKTNSRYKCISDKPLLDVQVLDSELEDFNYRRVAKEILATKDFKMFKYAFVGATLSCPNFNNFIPRSVQDNMILKISIRPEIQKLTNIDAHQKYLTTRFRNLYQKDVYQDTKYRLFSVNVMKNRRINSFFGKNRGTMCRKEEVFHHYSSYSANSTLNQYITDTLIKTYGLISPIPPEVRYLFESRGIDVSGWGMGINDYHRSLQNIFPYLASYDPLFKDIAKTGLPIGGREIDSYCTWLQKKSLALFPQNDEPIEGAVQSKF